MRALTAIERTHVFASFGEVHAFTAFFFYACLDAQV
jgi:hypothetical protein